jgi:hypothetical protein
MEYVFLGTKYEKFAPHIPGGDTLGGGCEKEIEIQIDIDI